MASGTALLAVSLLVALLLVPSGLSGAAPAPAAGARAPGGNVVGALAPVPLTVHPPALGVVAAPRPLATNPYYTQVGATLSELNGSASVTGLSSLSLRLTLVKSVYPIGYELNGLSSSGDWYQVLVGVNWPGCSGYEMLYEVWTSSGLGYAPGCDTTLTLHAGDLLQLGINFTQSGDVCMDLWDVSYSTEHSVCTAQPDSGATEFITLSGASNTNGYFTGPMTEIANTSATSCPDYRAMPVVSYQFPRSEYITAYQSWSDEFLAGSGLCYSQSGGTTISPGDPTTHFLDTASGTAYGPHYVAGQNYSIVSSSYGFRLETDPTPLTGVGLSGTPTTLVVGGSTTLTAAVSGGTAPYTALWALNGTLLGPGNLTRGFTTTASGGYRFSAYGVDATLQVVGPSNTVAVTFNAPLSASGPRFGTNGTGADVNESVVLDLTVGGGLPPYAFRWSGLPVECPGASAAAVVCRPNHVASYSISVAVTDANGTTVSTGPVAFVVSPALSPSVSLSAPEIDLNHSVALGAVVSGGSGGLVLSWHGLPPGCTPSTGIGLCTPTAPGNYAISFTVTDSNGALANATTAAFGVHPALTAGLSMDRPTVDAGSTVSFTALAGGGSGAYAYAWSGLPNGCLAGNQSLVTCVPTAGGTYAIVVNVTDSLGGDASAPALVVFLYPALGVQLNGSATAVVGSTLSLTATLQGGSPGASVRWSGLPDGCAAPAGLELVCTPTFAGSYNVTIVASDPGGGVATDTFAVVVGYPTPASGPLSTADLELLGVLVAGVVIGVVAGLARRRRRRAP